MMSVNRAKRIATIKEYLKEHKIVPYRKFTAELGINGIANKTALQYLHELQEDGVISISISDNEIRYIEDWFMG